MPATKNTPAAVAGQAERCQREGAAVPLQLALCTCCLRESRWTSYEEAAADKLCECGGEICPCASCLSVLEALKAGKRTAAELGTKSDVGEWSPERGCVGASATSASAPPAGGCGACGDACAARGGACQLREESPPATSTAPAGGDAWSSEANTVRTFMVGVQGDGCAVFSSEAAGFCSAQLGAFHEGQFQAEHAWFGRAGELRAMAAELARVVQAMNSAADAADTREAAFQAQRDAFMARYAAKAQAPAALPDSDDGIPF